MSHRDFDDAMGLLSRDLRQRRLVVFCGASGSGKSSAIEFLLEQHPHCAAAGQWCVIEELRHYRDLRSVWRALRHGQRLLIASHLPHRLHRCLALLVSTELIELDWQPHKIVRWLQARGIHHSSAAVNRFCQIFGANYHDAQLILNHYPAANFDQALGQFLRYGRLQYQPFGSNQVVLTLSAEAAKAHYATIRASSQWPSAKRCRLRLIQPQRRVHGASAGQSTQSAGYASMKNAAQANQTGHKTATTETATRPTQNPNNRPAAP